MAQLNPHPDDAAARARERDDRAERYEHAFQRADRLADYAPAPDFEPRTLGERHAEALENIDRGLDRVEALADECEQRIAAMLHVPEDELS